ncbi:hypothetical protein [Streptomyces sp. NPDC014894]|uniref:hypothetical protein n=1 Tax=unclassified Streptomyces TaxID=2593676 RepID=UPI0037006482
MSVTALRDLPPHLRLLAWPALNLRGELPGVRVTVPVELTTSPASLICYSRATRVEFDPGTDPGAALTAAEPAEVLVEPMRLVTTLALWDEVVRETGLHPGGLYLASEGSVARLLSTAHDCAPPSSVELPELLEQLHGLELIDRFPVAPRFQGAHGRERQCRINAWGRLLFRMLDGVKSDPYGIAAARGRLTAHLAAHREAYLRGVAASSDAAGDAGAVLWESIHAEQPIPVLV